VPGPGSGVVPGEHERRGLVQIHRAGLVDLGDSDRDCEMVGEPVLMTGLPIPPNGIGFRVDTWIDHCRQLRICTVAGQTLIAAPVAVFLAERLSGNGAIARGLELTPLRLDRRLPKTSHRTWHDCRSQPSGASHRRSGHSAAP
jgi:hypothetical protein